MFYRSLLFIVFSLSFLLSGIVQPVAAQGFGSNADNYYCAAFGGIPGTLDRDTFKCLYTRDDGSTFVRDALVKPPPLTILQVWFVRALYVIWGVSGVVFAFILMFIGGRYMLSFGNEVAVEKVIQGFQKWVLGLVLVFLSYPILATFFNLLPISNTSCYADIELPGFQFFFPEACVPVDASYRQFCLDRGFTEGNSNYYACLAELKCIDQGFTQGSGDFNACVRDGRRNLQN